MQYKGIIAGLLSGLLWGITGILYANLNELYPVTTVISVILFLLFMVEFTCGLFVGLSIFALYKRTFTQSLNKKYVLLSMLLGLIGGPIGMLCYLQAISLIGVGYAAPISSIYPVFGAILSFIFLKEKMAKIAILGGIITLASTFMLSLDIQNAQFSLLGISLALICALSWGSEIVLSSYVMKLSATTNAAKFTYFFRQFGAALGYFFLLLCIQADIQNIFTYFTHIKFDFFILAIVLSSMFSYILYYFAIDKLKPIKAMMLNITYGVWIVLLGILLDSSTIHFTQIFLIVGILLGAVLVLMGKKGDK